jgi:hypothetical protein
VPAHFTSAPCLISEAMCTTSRLIVQVPTSCLPTDRPECEGWPPNLGSTVALVANESINQHFKSPAENFCRW